MASSIKCHAQSIGDLGTTVEMKHLSQVSKANNKHSFVNCKERFLCIKAALVSNTDALLLYTGCSSQVPTTTLLSHFVSPALRHPLPRLKNLRKYANKRFNIIKAFVSFSHPHHSPIWIRDPLRQPPFNLRDSNWDRVTQLSLKASSEKLSS